MGQVWARVRAASAEKQRRAAREFAEAIHEALRASGDDLAAAGFEPPQTVEDWEHLARIVEMPFKTIRSGNFTYADVFAVAMAWVDRQKMKARLASESGAGGLAGQAPRATRRTGTESDTDEGAPPTLTPNEITALHALATFDPAELASADGIADATDPSRRVSEPQCASGSATQHPGERQALRQRRARRDLRQDGGRHSGVPHASTRGGPATSSPNPCQ